MEKRKVCEEEWQREKTRGTERIWKSMAKTRGGKVEEKRKNRVKKELKRYGEQCQRGRGKERKRKKPNDIGTGRIWKRMTKTKGEKGEEKQSE